MVGELFQYGISSLQALFVLLELIVHLHVSYIARAIS